MAVNADMDDLRSDLQGLSAEELHDLRDTIEEELKYLEQYSDIWNDFSDKYKASLDSLDILSKMNANKKSTLLKLGYHVFTRGTLIRPNNVLVYLGDGHYARMSLEDAKIFFKRKIGSLSKDYEEYENGKTEKEHMLMILQQVLESKIRNKIDNLPIESQSEIISSPN